MILRGTLVMVTCSNCGKEFNKCPSAIAQTVRGEHFCDWYCLQEYRAKEPTWRRMGLVPKERRVELAVESLERGEEYSLEKIRARVPPSR